MLVDNKILVVSYYMNHTNGHNGNKRRRGGDLEKALLAATRDELKEVGYRNLSLDSVALRAGTSKAVLYRRWTDRAELVVAALRDQPTPVFSSLPNTGTFRGDLLEIFGYLIRGQDALPMDIGLGLMTDTVHDAKRHEYYLREIKQASIGLMMPMLLRAEERGEIPTSALPERIITLPLDLSRAEIIRTGKPPTRAAVVQIIDDIYLPLLRSLV
jgi:AcrR family transcriptional regulator